ncbi:UNVERIFIED_CONTAM: hypothetical protein GTU68_063748, partial [Idotea baltica]|nr:hypothetical protein [Idotea baltica]
PAYILHSYPYRETSALIEFLTPNGRISAVLRNVRTKNGSLNRPFTALEIDLKGRSDLKTVSRIEAISTPYFLTGSVLFSGFYLNELLIRLLPKHETCAAFFNIYSVAISQLAQGFDIEMVLRIFERRLLHELGYGFSLEVDLLGQAIIPSVAYRLQGGFLPVKRLDSGLFQGVDLLAISAGQWSNTSVLFTAKRLMRQALAPYLAAKPLKSRELFMNNKTLLNAKDD